MAINNDSEHKILAKCRQANSLVQKFLDGSLPGTHLEHRVPRYIVKPQRRATVKEKVKKSLQVLENALDSHSLDEIAVSYNGGKDCLVMLTLLLAAIDRKIQKGGKLPENYQLDSIYVNSETPFRDLSSFIKQSTQEYSLKLITINSGMKEGFEKYLTKINSKTKAIVVGIRYDDPYGSSLSYEQVTDHDWPKFLRIHPILHWHYCDIWDFIIACDLSYCVLYDQGYTSLGGVDTTTQNSFLKQENGSFMPAYMLEEYADERERIGRLKKH